MENPWNINGNYQWTWRFIAGKNLKYRYRDLRWYWQPIVPSLLGTLCRIQWNMPLKWRHHRSNSTTVCQTFTCLCKQSSPVIPVCHWSKRLQSAWWPFQIFLKRVVSLAGYDLYPFIAETLSHSPTLHQGILKPLTINLPQQESSQAMQKNTTNQLAMTCQKWVQSTPNWRHTAM